MIYSNQNNVFYRFLPIPPSVSKGLEAEPNISDFKLIKELGIGSYGRVILVQHKKTHAKYAINQLIKETK